MLMKTKTYYVSSHDKSRLMKLLAGELEARQEIVFAYAYGSFAEANDLPIHDLDIGVYVSGLGKSEATPYALELGAALSKKSSIPIHVIVVNHAPIPFLYHVISGKAFLSRDDELRSRIVERAIQRYLDIKPLLLRGTKEAFAA